MDARGGMADICSARGSVHVRGLPGNPIQLHDRLRMQILIPDEGHQAALEVRHNGVRKSYVRCPRRGAVAGDSLDPEVGVVISKREHVRYAAWAGHRWHNRGNSRSVA